MVPKQANKQDEVFLSFRAVLFRMVPKQIVDTTLEIYRFRAVLFRMVPKHGSFSYK